MSRQKDRIVHHVDSIASSGTDVEAFAEALDALRDDSSLSRSSKLAVLKTLAQDQAVQYIAIVTGKVPRRISPES